MSVSEPTFAVAGFGRRAVAILIDWVASMLVALVWLGGESYATTQYQFTTLAVFFGEITILTWLTGASFGQRLVGIRIESIDGGPVSLPRVAARTALICLVIPAVVYDSDGRGLHDRAARSIAVRTRSARAR
jgi:uncharacterized RDD family membrane protein YckC